MMSVLCVVLPVVFCSFGIAKADMTTLLSYEFLPDESTVVRMGGFLGVHETYPVQGAFRLRVDGNGAAAFEDIDATLGDPVFFLGLGELFVMTELTGTVIDETTIEFVGQIPYDPSQGAMIDVNIDVTFQNDLVMLTGGFDEYDVVSDGYRYELSAVGQVPEPATLVLLALGASALIHRRRNHRHRP